ncbi:cytoplasmic protein [Fomitiporia mediterranea MF3/22]|uniref:cytoplasmic protein n=1 Tax=Fomitiporia mediterranea (strain MF3/22) TaxID=694068 RepID=UPI0004408E3B|nr:cytoplasmic protein [Fomitiporia mediterranea MF3/22]EJD05660.1 cytoplasmic protein [Fomitiporia mediterranea MF3/22]
MESSTGDISHLLTNLAKPKTSATLTLRIIKSFEYRTEKSLVLHDVNLETTTVDGLKARACEAIKTLPGWKAYRTLADPKNADDEKKGLDTIKLYTKAHGAKTTNLIINLDHDEWILEDGSKALSEVGFENETEASFFNRAAYEAFKLNPQVCAYS